jgi:hypothetical protein
MTGGTSRKRCLSAQCPNFAVSAFIRVYLRLNNGCCTQARSQRSCSFRNSVPSFISACLTFAAVLAELITIHDPPEPAPAPARSWDRPPRSISPEQEPQSDGKVP